MPGEAGPSAAQELFDAAVARFLDDPRLTAGTGFGSSPGRRVDGRIFAMLVRGDLVVKLPRQRVDALVGSGVAHGFDAGKARPMREWASIDTTHRDSWPALVGEAYDFVGSIEPTRKP
jgi:hypothetical protein